MKPLILLDLDHTLVNTTKLKSEFPLLLDAQNHLLELPSAGFDPYLYPDTIPFLNYAANLYQPAIYSEGPPDFQHHKITKSCLQNFIAPEFRFIYPPDTKLNAFPDLLSRYPLHAVVDDRPDVIDQALTLHLPAIRIDQGPHAHIDSIHPATFTVSTLSQIIADDLFSKFKPHLVTPALPN